MNRALIMVVRAGFLASTIMASPAFADVVIDLDLPENQGRTIWNVPQNTNIAVIGSRAPYPRQLSIQGARDVVVRGGIWKPTAKELSSTIHTKAITGAMTIFGAYINNSAARHGLVPNVDGRAGSVSFRGELRSRQASDYQKLYHATEIRSRSAATR
jgi:hypothetical protein